MTYRLVRLGLIFTGALAMSSFNINAEPIAATSEKAMEKGKKEAMKTLPAGLYAHFDTSLGKFLAKLMPEVAPKTVENFVALTEGTKEFLDPKTGEWVKRPFYDGLVFHRVIPRFMALAHHRKPGMEHFNSGNLLCRTCSPIHPACVQVA